MQKFFLVSSRLGFRWWSYDDINLARQLWGDPKVTQFFHKEGLSDSQIKERLEVEIKNGLDHGMQYWPIFLKESLEHVGCCGLRPFSGKEKIYELGFHLLPKFWNRGLATEAARAALGYGAARFTPLSIFAGHHPNNLASKKVLQKLGFRETEEIYYEPTGLFHPGYLLDCHQAKSL